MRASSSLLIATLALVAATGPARADSTAARAPVEAPAAGKRWSVTTNLAFLILPVVNAAAEYRLSDRSSASAHAGVGRVSVDVGFGDGTTNTVVHVGGAYRYYLLGDFDHGLSIGGDVRYVNAGSGKLLNVENAVAVAPFVGYKKIFGLGLTLDIALGAGLAFGESDGGLAPLIHAGIGWSF